MHRHVTRYEGASLPEHLRDSRRSETLKHIERVYVSRAHLACYVALHMITATFLANLLDLSFDISAQYMAALGTVISESPTSGGALSKSPTLCHVLIRQSEHSDVFGVSMCNSRIVGGGGPTQSAAIICTIAGFLLLAGKSPLSSVGGVGTCHDKGGEFFSRTNLPYSREFFRIDIRWLGSLATPDG